MNITIPALVWVNSLPSSEVLEEIQTTKSRNTFFLDEDVLCTPYCRCNSHQGTQPFLISTTKMYLVCPFSVPGYLC